MDVGHQLILFPHVSSPASAQCFPTFNPSGSRHLLVYPERTALPVLFCPAPPWPSTCAAEWDWPPEGRVLWQRPETAEGGVWLGRRDKRTAAHLNVEPMSRVSDKFSDVGLTGADAKKQGNLNIVLNCEAIRCSSDNLHSLEGSDKKESSDGNQCCSLTALLHYRGRDNTDASHFICVSKYVYCSFLNLIFRKKYLILIKTSKWFTCKSECKPSVCSRLLLDPNKIPFVVTYGFAFWASLSVPVRCPKLTAQEKDVSHR